MKKIIVLLAAAVATISFTMCSNNGKIPVESNWAVESLYSGSGEIAIPADHKATLAFQKDSKMAGDSGCNKFFGEFKAGSSSLTFSNMGSTRMMCPDMQFENAYMDALSKVASYKISEGKLLLLGNSGDIIAVLSQIEPVASEN